MYNSEWYYNLIRPSVAPPDWIFAPVWCFLYITIFVSLLFYIKATGENKQIGYIYFSAQIILNLLWTPVFFISHNIALALLIIFFLDFTLILTIKEFYTVSKPAGLMLLPYLIWVIFATYLNYAYLVLN